MEAPEVHKPHAEHHGALPRWLELVIAITALVTSISSIAIAVHHSHIMEKLVQANSIPYLQGTFTDVTPGGQVKVLHLWPGQPPPGDARGQMMFTRSLFVWQPVRRPL